MNEEMYWYDIDSVTDRLLLSERPRPTDFYNSFPVSWGGGYVYVSTKDGIMFLSSPHDNLEGKKIEIVCK